MAFNQPSYYQNPYMSMGYGQFQQPQMVQQPQQTQQQQTQQPLLYGKIVDCVETARSQDVPFGVSGIYPKADGTAVYIKQWMSDGTTKTNEYNIVDSSSEEKQVNADIEEKLNEIYDCIDLLGKKIDKIKTSSTTNTTRKKKIVEEVDDDE